jgi:hypothetical protein
MDGGSGPPDRTTRSQLREPAVEARATAAEARDAPPQRNQARLIARRLAATRKSVSRRALRSVGVKGSNDSLNALARTLKAELRNGNKGFIDQPS